MFLPLQVEEPSTWMDGRSSGFLIGSRRISVEGL